MCNGRTFCSNARLVNPGNCRIACSIAEITKIPLIDLPPPLGVAMVGVGLDSAFVACLCGTNRNGNPTNNKNAFNNHTQNLHLTYQLL